MAIKNIKGIFNQTGRMGFDDTLSEYEFLCMLLRKMEEVIDELNILWDEVDDLKERMEELEKKFEELRAEFEEFKKEVNERLDQFDERLTALEDKFIELETKFEDFKNEVNQKFEDFKNEVNQKFEEFKQEITTQLEELKQEIYEYFNSDEFKEIITNIIKDSDDVIKDLLEELLEDEDIKDLIKDIIDSLSISGIYKLTSYVSTMKKLDAKEGDIIQTLGYASIGDGGACQYYVRATSSTNPNAPNDMDIILLDNGLTAQCIYEKEMDTKQFGSSYKDIDAVLQVMLHRVDTIVISSNYSSSGTRNINQYVIGGVPQINYCTKIVGKGKNTLTLINFGISFGVSSEVLIENLTVTARNCIAFSFTNQNKATFNNCSFNRFDGLDGQPFINTRNILSVELNNCTAVTSCPNAQFIGLINDTSPTVYTSIKISGGSYDISGASSYLFKSGNHDNMIVEYAELYTSVGTILFEEKKLFARNLILNNTYIDAKGKVLEGSTSDAVSLNISNIYISDCRFTCKVFADLNLTGSDYFKMANSSVVGAYAIDERPFISINDSFSPFGILKWTDNTIFLSAQPTLSTSVYRFACYCFRTNMSNNFIATAEQVENSFVLNEGNTLISNHDNEYIGYSSSALATVTLSGQALKNIHDNVTLYVTQ